MFPALPLRHRRLHPGVDDQQLYGGIDLSAALSEGRFRQEQGLLSAPSTLILTMAERVEAPLAARLAGAVDDGHVLVALDEGAEPDDTLAPALLDRLAFAVNLEGVPLGACSVPMDAGKAHDGPVLVSDTVIEVLVALAAKFGISSARTCLLAVRCAKAHAGLFGRNRVEEADVMAAAALVYTHRATQLPQEEAEAEPPAPPEPSESPQEPDEGQFDIPEDMLVEAVRAALPADLLARLTTGARKGGKGAGAGAKQKGNRRGRPLAPRPGRPRGDARLDLVATLRTAAPWQRMRQAQTGRSGLEIRPSDLRVKRFESRSDRLLIFVVDASGSQALTRLAEAKGAVEMLLAEAYARRDHVALVAFRGDGAELLLPPTRSLVQTKRRLAGLPGGGGTPLASGLKLALETALHARAKGMTPTVALLSDGRANIALDGRADRTQAAADAEMLARALRVQQTDGLVIDTGARAHPALRSLAEVLGAPYLALPRADASRLSSAVSAALGD